ncbi:44398_t:CDS:2, partial [Gigaspora margarita]
ILAERLIPDFGLKLTLHYTNFSFPSLWQAFINDWNKHATTNIEPVAKKNRNIFLPTFKKTKRHHDYLLIAFDTDITIPTICQENDP